MANSAYTKNCDFVTLLAILGNWVIGCSTSTEKRWSDFIRDIFI